jgi:peptide/nickel transport system substrate-binding protein
MAISQKDIRYAWWIVTAFTKKNARLIILSFLLSIISMVSVLSLSPYLLNLATTKKHIIGITGKYDVTEIPDEIKSHISNGLIYINDKGEIVPVIADHWERTNDDKEYRFYLKKNLYWNNGDKFTTKDVTYSFKDVEVNTDQDYLITFKLKKPLPTFPTYLTNPIVKYPLVGVAGLYRVERLKSQYGSVTEVDLAPNKPNLPILVYKFYDSETKMVNAYKLGEITEMKVTRKSIADLFNNWKNTEIVKTVDYSRLLTLFFDLNNDFLKEKEIRQAMAMAVKRDDFDDLGQQATGPIPPLSWAYNPSLKKIQYNEPVASKILKKNQTSTESATLTINTYYDYLDIADQIKDDLNATGLNVRTNVLSDVSPNNFDMLLAYWRVPADPDQYYFWHSTQTQGNITKYDSKKVDKLLEDGRSTTSLEDRKKIYYTFQKVMMDDVPAHFLFYPYVYTIRRK